MKYILDTDILIYFLNGHADIINRMNGIAPENLFTTVINHTEILHGAFNSSKKEQNLKKAEILFDSIGGILPFCLPSSYIFAELKSHLKKGGKLIADFDLVIASIGLKNKITLVTNNTRDFARIQHLKLENWCNK